MNISNRRRAGRPRLRRRVRFSPEARFFKPQGIPMANLQIVELTGEELEALRLKNIKNLDQRECAAYMDTSPATLQRLLASAYQKISEALVKGQAIKIIEK